MSRYIYVRYSIIKTGLLASAKLLARSTHLDFNIIGNDASKQMKTSITHDMLVVVVSIAVCSPSVL